MSYKPVKEMSLEELEEERGRLETRLRPTKAYRPGMYSRIFSSVPRPSSEYEGRSPGSRFLREFEEAAGEGEQREAVKHYIDRMKAAGHTQKDAQKRLEALVKQHYREEIGGFD